MNNYPVRIGDNKQLQELLSRPTAETVEMFKRLDGDIIFLGIAGKIGPSLAKMARRASDEAGVKKRIIGVSRFRSLEEKASIEEAEIETIQGDLLDRNFLKSLPKVKNVFFLAGMKFGSETNLSLTWAMNTYLPALIVEHFKLSKIVAYSTGCVYPLVPIESGGSIESDKPEPMGEYAQSCLGRERMFEYGSRKNNTSVVLIRLNYAVEPRYGVLVDIATKVKNGEPVDLGMGYFNAIWQGDANDLVLRSLDYVESPAQVINISGPEIFSVRNVAQEFANLFDVKLKITGEEAETALLTNSNKAYELFGQPKVTSYMMLRWVANWLEEDGKTLGKPTHFEVRDGKY